GKAGRRSWRSTGCGCICWGNEFPACQQTRDPAMAQEVTKLLEGLSGQKPRRYSTFDFGRMKDEQCLSVVVPKDDAQPLVFGLRKQLPPDFVAFVGTTRWLGDEKHDSKSEVVLGKGKSQFDIDRKSVV